MIPIFIFSIIESSDATVVDFGYLLKISGAIITVLLIVISYFLGSLHNDFKKLKTQVYKNKDKISDNIPKAEADINYLSTSKFKTYEESIKEKEGTFKETLDKIDGSIVDLTKVTGKLNVSVAKLETQIEEMNK